MGGCRVFFFVFFSSIIIFFFYTCVLYLRLATHSFVFTGGGEEEDESLTFEVFPSRHVKHPSNTSQLRRRSPITCCLEVQMFKSVQMSSAVNFFLSRVTNSFNFFAVRDAYLRVCVQMSLHLLFCCTVVYLPLTCKGG